MKLLLCRELVAYERLIAKYSSLLRVWFYFPLLYRHEALQHRSHLMYIVINTLLIGIRRHILDTILVHAFMQTTNTHRT